MYWASRIWDSVERAAGWKVALAVFVFILILLAIGYVGKQFLDERRRRIEASLDRRREDERVKAERERRKDEVLEKIASNHIEHLELQLRETTRFFEAAVPQLKAMTQQLHEMRSEGQRHHEAMHNRFDKVEESQGEISGDVKEIKGRVA